MHQPFPLGDLARVVSSKLADGDSGVYTLQGERGTSDSSSFFTLRKRGETHGDILVVVYTVVTRDEFERVLLMKKFEQNVAFLTESSERNIHPLCPTIAAWAPESVDFPFNWIAFKDVDGWPLKEKWPLLKPEIRVEVIRNLATFIRELALVTSTTPPPREPSVGCVGSMTMRHILCPPVLIESAKVRPIHDDFEWVMNYGDLVEAQAYKRAAEWTISDRRSRTKSLAIDQLKTLVQVTRAFLKQPSMDVLAHLNLIPQNIWIDPFNGKITAIFGWELATYAPDWMATAPLPWLLDEKVDPILACESDSDPWAVWRPSFNFPPESIGKEMRGLRTMWEEAIRSPENGHPFSNISLVRDLTQRRAFRLCFVEEKKLGESIEWACEVVMPLFPLRKERSPRPFLLVMLILLVVGYPLYLVFVNTVFDPPATVVIAFVTIGWVLVAVYQHRLFPAPTSSASLEFHTCFAVVYHLLCISFRSALPWLYGYSGRKKEKERDGDAAPLTSVVCSPANSIVPDPIYLPGLLSRGPSTRGMPGK